MATLLPKPLSRHVEILQKVGLQSQVLVPTDAGYDAAESSYWSNSAKIKPACIVRPRSAEEVSTALKAVVAAGEKFAVRSGGHTQWAGSNNIAGGVTIDLSLLNKIVFDSESETAVIGPGGRWKEVYAELHKHGRVVAGGREGNVGVAGLLLGGGNTFFTAKKGFACDNVVEYEVVLADGTIVTASKQSHPDLFLVLKGGSNNFGIVTNFKMSTIKCDKVWGGMTFFPKTEIPQAIPAISNFVDQLESDPSSNLVCIFTYMPDFKDIVIATLYANVDGVEEPPIYKEWLALPKMMTMVKQTSVSEMAFEYNIPANYHTTWFTASFKNDTRIIAKASELHDALVEDLKAHVPSGDFVTQCLFQPLPKVFSANSVAAGGNIMGVERQAHNGLLWLATAMMKTPEDDAYAYPKIKAWVQAVKDFASTIDGGNQEWTYLNYADKSQDPLKSYGSKNLEKMREAAKKYDPEQVFQKLCPGGFKISEVA